MKLSRKVVMAAGAIAASALPWAATASPAGALDGDEHASKEWRFAWWDETGTEVLCSLHASASVRKDDSGGFIGGLSFALLNSDAACDEPLVRLRLEFTDDTGDAHLVTSESPATNRLDLAAYNVGGDVVGNVFVGFPACLGVDDPCHTIQELRPK